MSESLGDVAYENVPDVELAGLRTLLGDFDDVVAVYRQDGFADLTHIQFGHRRRERRLAQVLRTHPAEVAAETRAGVVRLFLRHLGEVRTLDESLADVHRLLVRRTDRARCRFETDEDRFQMHDLGALRKPALVFFVKLLELFVGDLGTVPRHVLLQDALDEHAITKLRAVELFQVVQRQTFRQELAIERFLAADGLLVFFDRFVHLRFDVLERDIDAQPSGLRDHQPIVDEALQRIVEERVALGG